MTDYKVKLMVDSGAYSAWNSDKIIDIQKYADFLLKYREYFNSYINLDSIPGIKGEEMTPQIVEKSAQKSWENLKFLEKQGLSPIPVYHKGDPLKWLFKFIDEGYKYIGLSPRARSGPVEKMRWLDSVFQYLTNKEGFPIVKTHGFAVTSAPLLIRYPWHSVDSTSWVMCAIFGGIYMPKPSKNKEGYDYLGIPNILKISKESPKKEKGLTHYYHSSELFKKYYHDYFDLMGITQNELFTDALEREKANLFFLSRLEKKIQSMKIRFDRSLVTFGFFSEQNLFSKKDPVEVSFTLYSATTLSRKSIRLVFEAGGHLLMSYNLFKDHKKNMTDMFQILSKGRVNY